MRFDRDIRMFESQFTADGEGFLYRKSLTGAPIPVTAEEKEAFVAQYRRARRLLTIVAGGLITMMVLIDVLATGGNGSDRLIYGATVTFLLVLTVGSLRLWSAPARVLGERASVGSPYTPDQKMRAFLASQSYRGLAFGGVCGAILPVLIAKYMGFGSAAGIVLLAVAVILPVGLAYRIFQKWGFERDGRE